MRHEADPARIPDQQPGPEPPGDHPHANNDEQRRREIPEYLAHASLRSALSAIEA
ncbi:hypothetical protein RxyAA322_05500 [Rubrobacter xylanophilus]|uniref:Uncharacterized protein n=1 Tax=Rubrobacter xylanophilus TaxID=49319 RepID=A0A510HFI8_9ACTN|nr:hypothetical protein RxyAA322_05500 [Rubrobacter xylanophilus]